jgi:hypothetical protein
VAGQRIAFTVVRKEGNGMIRRSMSFTFMPVSLLIAAFGAFSAAPAQATTPVASVVKTDTTTPLNSTGHICLKNASSWCIQTHGASQQVTITTNSANYATFTAFNKQKQFVVTTFELKDGKGNCLRGGIGNPNIVKIEDGGCVKSDKQDQWYISTSTSLINYGLMPTSFMATKSPAPGDKVYAVEHPDNGWWSQWTFPTP